MLREPKAQVSEEAWVVMWETGRFWHCRSLHIANETLYEALDSVSRKKLHTTLKQRRKQRRKLHTTLKQRRKLHTTLRVSHVSSVISTVSKNQSELFAAAVGSHHKRSDTPQTKYTQRLQFLSWCVLKHAWCVALPGVSCFCYCFPLSP